MTERKRLKKYLSKLNQYKKRLPALIDCSRVYGDNFYTDADLVDVERNILRTQEKINKIDGLK
jgi:hypothetical protein